VEREPTRGATREGRAEVEVTRDRQDRVREVGVPGQVDPEVPREAGLEVRPLSNARFYRRCLGRERRAAEDDVFAVEEEVERRRMRRSRKDGRLPRGRNREEEEAKGDWPEKRARHDPRV
jgi:hypothetical protein